MSLKQRLSASVDRDLIAAAEDAVAKGGFASISAWVNDALRSKVEHDRRLAALTRFVAEFERAHGAISTDEMEAAARRARGRATPVRSAHASRQPSRRRRAG